MLRVKWLLNIARNFLLFHVVYPWVKYGKNVHVQVTTHFFSPSRSIKIGSNVGIGRYCEINTDVVIGDNVRLGSHVGLIARDAHRTDIVGVTVFDAPRGDRYRIVVEDDVWIGFGAIILSGVTVGRGAIVAAGAVVVADVPSYSVVGGVPAKVLRMRFTPGEVQEHEKLLSEASVGRAG